VLLGIASKESTITTRLDHVKPPSGSTQLKDLLTTTVSHMTHAQPITQLKPALKVTRNAHVLFHHWLKSSSDQSMMATKNVTQSFAGLL
jgi:hypothetical protein